jgi:hypothetical protein
MFAGIIRDVEQSWKTWDDIQWVLNHHVDERIWEQDQQAGARTEVTDSNEVLPAGWRRMQQNSKVCYLHESGRLLQSRPIPDAALDKFKGWVKYETKGTFCYMHVESGRMLRRPPGLEDSLPTGWEKRTSRSDPNKVYYYHNESGRTQLGMPCEGSLDPLPENWEKVLSKSGKPYYFNIISAESQMDKPPLENKAPKPPLANKAPTAEQLTPSKTPAAPANSSSNADAPLPPNWIRCTSKSTGQTYYSNTVTNVTQWIAPTS